MTCAPLDESNGDTEALQQAVLAAGQAAGEGLYIAGVGASAGGLEALERLFKGMPGDSGIAFVVIQHLSPDFKSLMDELLARHTKMPIFRGENGMAVRANCIYLMPAKKEMIISGGQLLLTDKSSAKELSLPIDHFFRSLAQDAGRRAIAIVLSGTGSDGSRGIRDVDEAGGFVIAQSEESAKFDGMPKSARDTGVVDCVLAPEAMPSALIEHVSLRLADEVEGPSEHTETAGVQGVEAIFKLLRDEYGIDFSFYKPNTVARRIERRLSLNQSIDLDDYVERLRSDAGELNSLYRDLLIGVTRFFRDTQAFERLEREVLPELLVRKRPDEELRIWVAGCATGEEAYSLAILVHEQLQALKRPTNVKIFAGDVHRTSLDIASAGVYSEEALSEVTPARLARYFAKKGNGYHVANELRQMIVFARHNVIKDAPFTKLDLISCRNLLIYFQPPAQKKILSLFHFGLKTGSVLFLGPSESPGELAPEFETLDEHWKLYRKRRDIRLPADMRLPLSFATPHIRLPSASSGGEMDAPLLATYDGLLDEYMPPGLLVTAQRQLVHAFGDAGKILRYRAGRPTADILDLLEGDLKLSVAGALQRAAKEQATVVYKGIRIKTADREEQLKLTIKPIFNRHSNLTHWFIAMESQAAAPAPAQPASEVDLQQASRDHVSSLENELRYARENLQATIEELETSNEELQASNEELVASNEELQSTNEELHSVNEELYTVNAEFQKKIAELTEVTDDMNNLLHSTDIATIFLDRSLCIRKFTPQIARAFDLLPHDVGRRIDSFSHNILYTTLLEDINSVLKTGTPIEQEVQDRRGSWFLLRLLPYRSHSELDGVVLSLIDISLLKRTFARLAQMSAIVESSNDAIIGLDLEGNITTWNQGAEHLYGYVAKEVVGRNATLLHLDGGQQQLDWTPETLARMRAGQPADYQMEAVRRHKNGTKMIVLLSLSSIRDSGGVLTGVSMIVRDITEQKRAEKANRRYATQLESANQKLRRSVQRRRRAEEKAQEAVQRRDQFLAMLSHELRNPLAAVLNASYLLQNEAADAEIRQAACGAINRQSRQMARLLDDLLDVSRITRDKIEIRKQAIDLRQTSEDAVEAISSLLASRRIDLNVELPDAPVWVHGDSARLQQIQVNLLINAVKYTAEGGRIWLTMQRERNEVVLRVCDTGVGIPIPMQERIFELFVQLDGAPGKSDGGMGVGLTLVRALVKLHGGSITVQSDGEGQGSEFIVRLPAHDREPVPVPATKPQSILFGLRVLLVDDHADIQAVTSRLLEREGCQVFTVENGRSAIEAIERFKPDIALIDIGLPDMNGYEVARRIRQLSTGGSVGMFAVTGFGQPEERKQALQAGFNGHLVKPINFDELATHVSRLRETWP